MKHKLALGSTTHPDIIDFIVDLFAPHSELHTKEYYKPTSAGASVFIAPWDKLMEVNRY
jgi:hypothetical protein